MVKLRIGGLPKGVDRAIASRGKGANRTGKSYRAWKH